VRTLATVKTYLTMLLSVAAALSFALETKAECVSQGHNALTGPTVSIANMKPSCARESSPQPYTATRAFESMRSVGMNHSVDVYQWPRLFAGATSAGLELKSPAAQSLSGVQWADSHDWIHNPPAWIREAVDNARSYKKRGMPIVHLWTSEHAVLAIGVNPHGNPGLYFSQKLPF
jgi:hypothetical protein